jgi:RNA polymerase sigma-70 factor (ECF subfamily)
VLRLRSFEPRHEGAFQAYVRQALRTNILDEIKKAQRNAPPELLDSRHPSREPSPLEEAIGTELLEQYEAALQRVKPEDREALVARIEMGLSWPELKEALGKNSAGSAQMTVKRALVRLAKEMSRGDRA